jgi:hypothetical protein
VKLRPEVLRHARPDGGVDLYDPLLERLVALSSAEAASLDAPDAVLLARLDGATLLEGAVADAVRASVWATRVLPLAAAPPVVPPRLDPSDAAALPALVAPAWREPEAWRRLAEDRAAGRARLTLRGFLGAEYIHTLTTEAGAAAFARFETDRVHAWRAEPGPAPVLDAWRALLLDPALRALVGGALGASLPDALVLNAWRMGPGDGMRAHPDGRRYAATWALGLCDAWTAADGGAIAFGAPTPEAFVVTERWLPFAGDLLLFVPGPTTWHVVETPARERLTLSGWWTA